MMRISIITSVFLVAANALLIQPEQQILGNNAQTVKQVESDQAARYLIELNPGETRLVTEDQKWALKRVLFSRCFAALRD